MSPAASRRCFRFASIGHILVGLAHFNGQFLSRLLDRPMPAAEREIMDRMAAIGGEMLGLRFTMIGVMDCLGLFYTVFCLFLGIQNLALLRMVDEDAPAPRALAWLNAALCAALGAIALLLGLAPPLVCYAVLAPLFALSASGSAKD
jgi:hypothetical protein